MTIDLNVLLLGMNKDSYALAKLIQKFHENPEENTLILDGVFCGDISQTTTYAVSLGIKAYVSIEDALRNCDVLFIAPSEAKLLRFVESLKEQRIRNKILCHFSEKYDSSALCGGTTNTCYSINLPYSFDSKRYAGSTGSPIIVQGEGKRDAEFRACLENSISNPVFYVTTKEKGIVAIAKRVVFHYTRICIKAAMHLFKIAGIYDKESFRTMCCHMMEDIVENVDTIPKLDATALKKNKKLLSALDYDDTKEFVRNMEIHIMKTSDYSLEEKQDIAKVLHCKY